MKIAVLTPLVPFPTNERGPTALLHSLLSRRPDHIKVDLYYVNHGDFNAERIRSSLGSLNTNQYREIKRLRGAAFAIKMIKTILFGYPYECGLHDWSSVDIDNQSYDAIMAYTFWPLPSFRNTRTPIHVIGPDCASLHHKRTVIDHPGIRMRAKSVLRYFQFVRLERASADKAHGFSFVGQIDKLEFDKVTSSEKSVFLLHPLSDDVLKAFDHNDNGIGR
jgi:hypothetical protein